MPHVLDRADVVIYRDVGAYISHPCVARLDDDDLLVAFNEGLPRRPWLHPPKDPRFMSLVARSRDGGATWQLPRVAPGYDVTGTECPSIVQIASGEVLLVQWRYGWYPIETARQLWARPDNTVRFTLPERRGWLGKEATTEADWDECPFPWAQTDAGVFVSISTDRGATWDATLKAPTGPYARGYSPRPPTQLPDGTLLLALDSHDAEGAIYVLRSADGGRSWAEPPVTVSNAHPLAEPTILALSNGHVIIHSRDEHTSHLHQHDSYDGGQTWEPPWQTPIWGYPAHLLHLSDGRLLTVYGVRRPPYGIRACLSDDEGETWQADREIIIRDDMKNGNLGYPTAVELPGGRLFCAYYGEDAEGVTHLIGSSFRLPT